MGVPRFKQPNRTNSSRRTSPVEQLPIKKRRHNEYPLPSPASEQLKAEPSVSSSTTAVELQPSRRPSYEDKIDTEHTYLPWAQKYEPKTLDEVAIHPSKRSEIYDALDPRLRTRVLIVSGPAGSSKSTCIKLSAEARGQSIIEFQAPESIVGSTTFVNSFREFLIGCAIYERSKYVILVEELPALFHEDTREAFEDALLSWADEPDQPIIAIAMTEIEVSARFSEAIVVPRVLGQLVNLGGPEVVWLKTNAINLTTMQKHLKAVAQQEDQLSMVPAAVFKLLAQCGDIRSAINALEFLCLSGMPKALSPENVWTRGAAVELFYVIGKIVWTSSKKGSLEESLGMFEDSIDSLHLTVLENYTSAKHQRLPLSAAAETTEWLSIADMFSGDTSIGALGAANAIAEATEDTHLPKKFVQTRFTQYPKWQSEKHAEQSKLLRLLKNARQSGSLINRAVVLDTRAFESKFLVRNSITPLADSDDDDDDFCI